MDSTTLNRMLYETESSLNDAIKLAYEDPKLLQDKFVEKLRENTADKIEYE